MFWTLVFRLRYYIKLFHSKKHLPTPALVIWVLLFYMPMKEFKTWLQKDSVQCLSHRLKRKTLVNAWMQYIISKSIIDSDDIY